MEEKVLISIRWEAEWALQPVEVVAKKELLVTVWNVPGRNTLLTELTWFSACELANIWRCDKFSR